LDEIEGKWVAKLTIPYNPELPPRGHSAFGFTPRLIRRSIMDFRLGREVETRPNIEFSAALPLEYLDRWVAVNDIFADDVSLHQVVQWRDGHVSFGLLQPVYDGEAPSQEAINEYFLAEGWTWVADPTREHTLYYNYAFQVMAIDAVPRNCREKDGYLMPFDVILCRPDAELERFLEIYPD
jgi:hypothetical protein